MTLKEQLIQEIEQIPDDLLSQLLDYILFLKERYINQEEEITEEEKAMITASQAAYESGDYMTLDEYEECQN
jgi:hypothetical protein